MNTRSVRRALFLCAALAFSGCGNSAGAPTDTSPVDTGPSGPSDTDASDSSEGSDTSNGDTDTEDTPTDTDPDTDTGSDPLPFKGVGNSRSDELAAYQVSWCYNWMTHPEPENCGDPLFVPMIKYGTNVAAEYADIVAAGYTTVLGFNEPNKQDQANMTVAEALDAWPALTSNPAVRVGSPSVSDDGRWWLEEFMAGVAARGLRVDFITVHWYGWNAGSCDNAGGLEGALNWAEQWGRPIWLTEFGCMHESNPDPETVEGFYEDALAMFENHPSLERYAWYPWNPNSELSDRAYPPILTPLGELFAAAPAFR